MQTCFTATIRFVLTFSAATAPAACAATSAAAAASCSAGLSRPLTAASARAARPLDRLSAAAPPPPPPRSRRPKWGSGWLRTRTVRAGRRGLPDALVPQFPSAGASAPSELRLPPPAGCWACSAKAAAAVARTWRKNETTTQLVFSKS